MKIKSKNSRIAGSKGKPVGQQTITPTVIELPDNTTSIDSSDLYAAATSPESALAAEPEIRVTPMKSVADAEFEELPLTEAELTANKLLQDLEDEDFEEQPPPLHPAEVLWATDKDPIESAFANGSYRILSEGGQKLLSWFSSTGHAVSNAFKQAKLRTIALGNGVLDFVNKQGNRLWKVYDNLRQNPAAPYIWMKETQAKVVAWLAERNKHSTKASIQELTQAILDLQASHQEELRRLCKRISALERGVDKNTRGVNRLSDKAAPIETDQLKTLMLSVKQNRKVDTVNLVRAITGGTLAAAKTFVEEISAPLN